MVCLDETELESLSIQLLQQLRGSEYECSSLTLLGGGSTNFVYRGTLSTPCSTLARNTVIVKHTKDFLAVSRDFEIDGSRCLVEAAMLRALQDAHLPFKTPTLLHIDIATRTQVHEDFGDALNLTTILRSPSALDRTLATTIGFDVGSCLKSFHSSASSSSNPLCRDPDGTNNTPMREMKHRANYESFMGVLDRIPGIVTDECRQFLVEVKDMAAQELTKRPDADHQDEHWGLIHGDCCSGNVLLLSPPHPAKPNEMVIIDWELAQYGHRAYDLGQFIGDLCEIQLLDSPQNARWAIKGFVRGYGGLSDDLAFRTAIHAGVHFVHWYVRRPPTAEMRETPAKISDAMELARDFVVKGWTRDREWFRGTLLAPLFVSEA